MGFWMAEAASNANHAYGILFESSESAGFPVAGGSSYCRTNIFLFSSAPLSSRQRVAWCPGTSVSFISGKRRSSGQFPPLAGHHSQSVRHASGQCSPQCDLINACPFRQDTISHFLPATSVVQAISVPEKLSGSWCHPYCFVDLQLHLRLALLHSQTVICITESSAKWKLARREGMSSRLPAGIFQACFCLPDTPVTKGKSRLETLFFPSLHGLSAHRETRLLLCSLPKTTPTSVQH